MKPSNSGELNKRDWQAWGKNVIKFVAPTMGIFFGQLALGVNIKIASAVAALALYQALADLFSKYQAGK